jgi:hypothetical protein
MRRHPTNYSIERRNRQEDRDRKRAAKLDRRQQRELDKRIDPAAPVPEDLAGICRTLSKGGPL